MTKVSRVSEVSKVSGGQGRLAYTTTLETAKGGESTSKITLAPCGRGQNFLANGCELRNSGEGSDKSTLTHRETAECNGSEMLKQVQHDGTRYETAEPASCKSLVPQCLVLDLLHARRVSPVVLTHKPAQSARYPDSLTSFAPSVRKSASNLVPFRKAAFTLAEVLITLAIIGIMATLTIPNLIQSYKKTEYSSKLKKFYSTMQQAIQMSQLDNGLLENWEFQTSIADEEGNRDYDANHEYEKAWLSKYILPYMKYNKISDGSYSPETDTEEAIHIPVTIYLNDGSTFSTFLGSCMDIIYDVNGAGAPNTTGQDQYRYTFCFSNSGPQVGSQGFHTYLYNRVTSRQNALELCKTQPAYCSNLLRYDNWEFKDDYPYKL